MPCFHAHHSAFSRRAGNAAVLTFPLNSERMQILAIFTPPTARRSLWRAAVFTAWLASLVLVAPPVRAQDAGIEGKTVAEVRVVNESGAPVTGKDPAAATRGGEAL